MFWNIQAYSITNFSPLKCQCWELSIHLSICTQGWFKIGACSVLWWLAEDVSRPTYLNIRADRIRVTWLRDIVYRRWGLRISFFCFTLERWPLLNGRTQIVICYSGILLLLPNLSFSLKLGGIFNINIIWYKSDGKLLNFWPFKLEVILLSKHHQIRGI